MLDRSHTIAPPGFNRWLVPPAAIAPTGFCPAGLEVVAGARWSGAATRSTQMSLSPAATIVLTRAAIQQKGQGADLFGHVVGSKM